MTNEKKKLLCVDSLRHAEYYDMQNIFDELYTKSKDGEVFTNLMPLVLSPENIMLAYRNIKANTGSKTAGTDKLTMKDIGKLTADEVVEKVRYILTGSPHGYRPKPVRRKEIPKPYDPTKTRPLGIPCIWDRLIQQSIKQILEPICEAKFSNNSFGFRPNRGTENAMASCSQKLMLAHLHYVIEFDIKGFFDNVNHSKLIKQIWAMGIRDKALIYIIRKMLSAPVKMLDGKIIIPDKGAPQGGIISPLLANIVLNELDQWIDGQWLKNPVGERYINYHPSKGRVNRGGAYRAMRKTKLKEMYIVRYADDFRIFCRTMEDAERTKIAVTQWIEERLKLEVSQEKTRIVNAERHYSEFLGFKMKVHPKKHKKVVVSHVADKNLTQKKKDVIEQAKRIARPRQNLGEAGEIRLYNSMVMGLQNYYRIATHVSCDFSKIMRAVMVVLTNRLKSDRSSKLVKTGRKLTEAEIKLYGNTPMWRYVAGCDEPIYPIGKIQHKPPLGIRNDICSYTAEGRKAIHDNLRIDKGLMLSLMRTPRADKSIEYTDNRISLFSAQRGKCAITGREFLTTQEIHCHHITPKNKGGSDAYANLVLVLEEVHQLIHAKKQDTIRTLLDKLKLDKSQIEKVNKYRVKANLLAIQ